MLVSHNNLALCAMPKPAAVNKLLPGGAVRQMYLYLPLPLHPLASCLVLPLCLALLLHASEIKALQHIGNLLDTQEASRWLTANGVTSCMRRKWDSHTATAFTI